MNHDPPCSINSTARNGNNSAGGWPHGVTADPNLLIIVAFCAVGLLVTFSLIVRSSFEPSVEEIVQFTGRP
jgi:hypothetical protein